MFFRKKKLFEYDPKTLSLELLSHLQASLIAKLILVNNELQSRFTKLAELSSGLDNVEDARKVMSDGADRLGRFNIILNLELERISKSAAS